MQICININQIVLELRIADRQAAEHVCVLAFHFDPVGQDPLHVVVSNEPLAQ
jgi:hypothetical protein